MEPISIRLHPDLYKSLLKKAKELGGLSLSDTIRILLRSALDEKTEKSKQKQLQYIAGTYYLLNEYITQLGGQGAKINKKAHAKAEQVVADLIQ